MRHLLFIVFLVAALITAGCAGVNQKPAGTPAPQIVYDTVPVTLTPVVTVTPAVTPVPITTVTNIPASGAYQTYTSKEFNFSIQYPESWTVSGEYVTVPGGGKKYQVDFTDPALKSKQYLSITPDSGGLSLEDWANIFEKQVKTDPSVSVVGQYPMQLDGAPAKKMVLTYGSGEYATESTIIMTIKGDNAYFMEFTSRKADYAGYSRDAESMVKTMKFT